MSKERNSEGKPNGISVRWLVIVTTSFIVMATLATQMQNYFAQRAQINALRNQVADANSALEQAKRDLARWNDPTYVAAQARTRLHFVFPGERQYAVTGLKENPKNSDQAAAAVSDLIPSGLPWYGRLMASITATNATN